MVYVNSSGSITSNAATRTVVGENAIITNLKAEIDRLTAERDSQYEMNAGLIAKQAETEAQLADARASAAAAYERAAQVADACEKQNSPKISDYHKGLSSGGQAIAAGIRALATEAETTALAEIVKKAVDAETRACAEVAFPSNWREEPTYKTKLREQKLYSEGFNACRAAILARLDQPKAESV